MGDSREGAVDIGVLKLDGPVPKDVHPARVARAENPTAKHVEAWGFPLGYGQGKPAQAVVTGTDGGGWVHLHSRSDDVSFLPGHSGAPVMLVETGVVIGMLVMTDSEKRDVALAIPSQALQVAWPRLELSEPWGGTSPYRGMQALQEDDGHLLFGRDKDITAIVQAIADERDRLLLLLGASGVGKSSLIFAGVFSALKCQSLPGGAPWPKSLASSATWKRLTLSPGAEPLRSLAGAFLAQWLDPGSAEFRSEANAWRALLLEGDTIEALPRT